MACARCGHSREDHNHADGASAAWLPLLGFCVAAKCDCRTWVPEKPAGGKLGARV